MDAEATGVRPINPPSRGTLTSRKRDCCTATEYSGRCAVQEEFDYQRSDVGFTPDSGRVAATQPNDASGQPRTSRGCSMRL